MIADGSPKMVVITRTVCPEDLQGSQSPVFSFSSCIYRTVGQEGVGKGFARRAIAYYHSAVCQLHYSAFYIQVLPVTSTSFISSSFIQLVFCADKVTSIDLN